MPASTPLGITYPCSGDTIDPNVFKTYADTTQAAIDTVQDLADSALYPPAVQGRRFSDQNFNLGVTTTLTWEFEAYESTVPGGMFTPTSGTFTVGLAGSYLIGVNVRLSAQPANMTSFRVAILLNGVEIAYSKGDSGATAGTVNTEFSVTGFAPAIAAGSTFTSTALYTGAASPVGVTGTFSLIRIASV
jgi:hypothetical protein